ncbi:MAG: hypothetical protein M3N68_01275 [Actinomycetota bacterium]|nr:hypothetical protein [Actinomycetota bacterium]
MRFVVALAHLVLGTAYVSIGALILIDMKRGWAVRGFSRFGAGLTAIAFTCGPHHLVHGVHVGFEGRIVGALDLVTVVVGLPFAAAFYALRVEAFFGGRGDRFVSGTPGWVMLLPAVAGGYVTGLAFSSADMVDGRLALDLAMAPQVLLIGIYVTIGYFLFRTQLHNHRTLSGWSLSGGAMTGIFLTCAAMHAVLVVSAAADRPMLDGHGFLVNALGVPAGLYFLSVVRRLYHDVMNDWNASAVDEEPAELAARAPA